MSIYLFFCLPRLRSPRTSDFIILLMLVSPDRSTCPYHLSLASRILSVMHATPIFFRMFSFLCISFSEIPSIHLSILISVLSEFFLLSSQCPCLCSIHHNWSYHCLIYFSFEGNCDLRIYNTIQYNTIQYKSLNTSRCNLYSSE